MKLALDVGFGGRKVNVDGYDVKTLDIRGELRPDLVAPIDNIPVPDETFDLVFASHVLEHVKRNDVHKTLKEWRRILAVDGKLQIIVPDLEVAAIELLSCRTSNDTFDILWGAQNYPENCHYTGYTWQLLEALISKFGFDINHLECKDRCIHMTATKTKEVFYA